MKIESPIFINNALIPTEYTCYGNGIRPIIKIFDVPQEAESLAIIVDDPDAPSGDFVHWVIWNISPQASIIESDNLPMGSVEGLTSLNKPGFIAPCPPSGIHRYYFKLYALDTILSIPKSSNKNDLMQYINEHVIDNAVIMGLYKKEN